MQRRGFNWIADKRQASNDDDEANKYQLWERAKSAVLLVWRDENGWLIICRASQFRVARTFLRLAFYCGTGRLCRAQATVTGNLVDVAHSCT